MLQGQTTGERVDPLAAILHDESLTDLLRIHMAGPDAERREGEPAQPDLVPALLGAYLELESIRHDFPAVLVDDRVDTPVVSLTRIFDEILDQVAASGAEAENLRGNVYRLEASIKRVAQKKRARRLSELWTLATEQVVEQSEHPDRVRASLDTVKTTLAHDGRLISCGPRTARQIFEHAWWPLQSERAEGERIAVEELIARLSEVLESERARSPKSTSPEALEAALGGEHAGGIDFKALSALLRHTRHTRVMPAKRLKRLRIARKVLMAERALLPSPGGNGKRRTRDRRRAGTCHSCAEALELFDTELKRRVELIREIRVSNLELENRYREERHDSFFKTFGPEQLTPEDYRALPPLLVFLSSNSLSDAEKSTLVDILGSDMPVKVLLEINELPVSDPSNAPPGSFTEWTQQIARMTMSLGEAFVLQTAASHLPQLAPQIVAGLRREGPALFCIYTGPDVSRAVIPHYLRCASAVESRAFPSFVYDPDRGGDWASQFSLEGSPQVDRDWPEQCFAYETTDGQAASESLVFTCVDFLMLDPGFAQHFVIVPPSRWHANMVPMAQYLSLSRQQALDKVPFVYLIDAEDRVHRVVVRRALVASARKCLASWRRLQELGGIRNSPALRLLEEQRARLEEEHQRAIKALEAAHPVQTDTTMAESVPAEAEPPEQGGEAPAAEVSPPSDQAYIDTELCTTCDDCIERNARMFAYNEAKQAYIKDIRSGTYRELVEAAENCPVCIIHPGKPCDPSEPGLEELQKRAESFN
ncbi:MAG: ferredoxin [Betaproteobacteria bacterium]|nr:ferredoxin [Gammaproteobacteria bacterium]MDH3435713.1 ferredoxin [Betaproteobacteria bacterium]